MIESIQQKCFYIIGRRRMVSRLKQVNGITLGESQIGRLMRTYDVKAKIRQIRKTRFVNKNILREGLPGNLLNRQFHASRPREKLLTDVTYVPYYENGQWHWGYLSLVLDLFDRSIVAWVYSKKHAQQLALNTIERYLEFYNHQRPSSVLNNMAPIVFRNQFATNVAAVN